jgi:hypothetical protein
VITSEAAGRMMGYARQALADRGIDLGIGAPAPAKPPAQNPTIFDLSTYAQFSHHKSVATNDCIYGFEYLVGQN